LRSPNWDTRIAAGQAVEAIVKNIPEWNPTPKPKDGEMSIPRLHYWRILFFVIFYRKAHNYLYT